MTARMVHPPYFYIIILFSCLVNNRFVIIVIFLGYFADTAPPYPEVYAFVKIYGSKIY